MTQAAGPGAEGKRVWLAKLKKKRQSRRKSNESVKECVRALRFGSARGVGGDLAAAAQGAAEKKIGGGGEVGLTRYCLQREGKGQAQRQSGEGKLGKKKRSLASRGKSNKRHKDKKRRVVSADAQVQIWSTTACWQWWWIGGVVQCSIQGQRELAGPSLREETGWSSGD